MDASYLRVKNWGRLQHYDPTKRRPPWIKVYNDLLGDDDAFMRLDEDTQYQLLRIWLVASRSSSLTRDEDGKIVPVVANDATSLQRSIMSLRRVPLERLIRDGWLIPVGEDELLPAEEAPKRKRRRASASGSASNGASANANGDASAALRGREGEVQRGVLGTDSGRQSETRAAAEEEGLPFENIFLTARLLNRIGDHADAGTEQVVRSYAKRLPQASLVKVVESLDLNHPGDRAAYAVAALRSELEERRPA